jgi:hypothetical protein
MSIGPLNVTQLQLLVGAYVFQLGNPQGAPGLRRRNGAMEQRRNNNWFLAATHPPNRPLAPLVSF